MEVFAFAYDRMNEDYKLVIVVHLLEMTVYRLGSNLWENIPVTNPYWIPKGKSGVLVKGDLHWLASGNNGFCIVSLDMSNEKFEEIQLSEDCFLNGPYFSLGMLRECLSLLVEVDKGQVEVLVMQEYGVRQSWARRYIITHEIILRTISANSSQWNSLKIMWTFKNGEILFVGSDNLVYYDPKHGSVVERNLNGLTCSRNLSYVESLISPNSGTYLGREHM
ncbi:F-box/kelch-repeat protein At3g06240-like [Papaver somniferum]|uniref:F-box/kelch-repeat protein At3g06240-like n=1 Tax=Papaver somniferum TaxID=3469 RepID=UPI000E6FE593|nr:F-box/kelch-repeat protein At3g06240-like [Papaver somniferum]